MTFREFFLAPFAAYGLLVVLGAVANFTGCQSAHSSPHATIEVTAAPDGARCYVIITGNDTVAGGNCVK